MTDYAGPILGAVGAVVGFVATGYNPAGAQWGWAIGSAIGGAYAQSQQVIPGPKIGDVQKQTSQEGGFRSIVYGRSIPITGNVIADGGPRKVKNKESGKGGPKVESESAFRTYAVGFCEGETTLLQAWRNGILVYDAEDPSMSAENEKFLEYAKWYSGGFSQGADPDLEAIYGVGNAPFFRGTSYLRLADEDVTDGRGMWSQWQVRVFRKGPSDVVIEPSIWDEATQTGGGLQFIGPGYSTVRGTSNTAGFITADTSVSDGDWYWETTTGWYWQNGSEIRHYGQAGIIRQSDDAYGLILAQIDADGGAVATPTGTLFENVVLYEGWIPPVSTPRTALIRNRLTYADGAATWIVAVDDGDWVEIMSDVSGTFAPYACSRGTNQDSGISEKDVTIYSRPEDFTYGVPDGAQPLGLASPNTDRNVDWFLPEVIEDVCARANLASSRIDQTLMPADKVVRGYTIPAAYQASGILQVLSSIFFFDPANTNGKVSFVPRGRDAEATIYESDMIDDDGEVEDSDSRRQDSIGIPRVLHLNYYDVKGGLNTDKQRSERPEGTRADGEQSLQTPVVLSADEAATVVARTHGLMVEQQKGELNWALPDNWLRLTESDAVFVQTDTKMVRAILIKVETDDGEQRYKAIRDRQSLYTMQVQGIPAAPVTRPPSSVAGPTLIEIIDIPPLRDAHDMLGFYVAASGIYPAWPGAQIELSLDGGETYIEGQSTTVGSVMGTLTTSLGDHPQPFPDEVNSCQVQITTPNAELLSTTLVGMMNRTNLAIIGNEIVNFAGVDEVSEGVWEISSLLRGRKGTATSSHAIGERFVLLNSAVFVPAELSWLGRSLTFRAATMGRPVDEATIVTITFTGQSQTERQPAYLQARRDGTDAVMSWQGVGRLGAGVNIGMGAYFAGYRVTLTDGATTQTIDTVDNTLTTSLSAFAGAVTVKVQQRNQLTGLGPAIEVTI